MILKIHQYNQIFNDLLSYPPIIKNNPKPFVLRQQHTDRMSKTLKIKFLLGVGLGV